MGAPVFAFLWRTWCATRPPDRGQTLADDVPGGGDALPRNWCYHKTTLMSFAKHYKTGETLPDDLYDKLVEAKNYRSGTMMLRQLHFSVTDLDLHARFTPGQGESVYDREKKIAEKTTVMPPLDFDRFLCGFSHIFAGGYAAGYFSYKWAEVLS